MAKRTTDPNEAAASVVRAATGKPDELPETIEAAWNDWKARIHSCDERTKTLARAAFDVGVEAGARLSASELGKRGASKGGEARAASLSASRRKDIAKQAATARWSRLNREGKSK